jgi:hypothetical protein
MDTAYFTRGRKAGGPLTMWLLPLAVAALGCSDSTADRPNTDNCLETLDPALNSEFCNATPAATDCSLAAKARHQVCGVPLEPPPEGGDLVRSSDVEEFAGSGAPDLGCFNPASYPAPPDTSQAVSVRGIAKIFSNGCESSDLTIEAYTVQRGGDPASEGMIGELIGSAVVTDSDCELTGAPSEHDDCGTRWECTYDYPGVPTETELVFKTSGDNWSPLYLYNVYISNDDVVDGVWEFDLRALARGDYTLIPQVAIGGPVSPGHGVIAGEIHDCGDVRLINAVADIDRPKKTLVYFGDDEDSPLPDLGADATKRLGLYSAMDVAPGPVTVAAAGAVDGTMTTLGFLQVQVYPDSVTSVTFRGLRPFQVP